MNRQQITGYQPANRTSGREVDVSGIISGLPTLTKIGGACLIAGKFVGLLAIPAVFIPALHSIGIILVITWGALVFTSIILCSYEHFRKKDHETTQEKVLLLQKLLKENPALIEELTMDLEQEQVAEETETQKVIRLRPRF